MEPSEAGIRTPTPEFLDYSIKQSIYSCGGKISRAEVEGLTEKLLPLQNIIRDGRSCSSLP